MNVSYRKQFLVQPIPILSTKTSHGGGGVIDLLHSIFGCLHSIVRTRNREYGCLLSRRVSRQEYFFKLPDDDARVGYKYHCFPPISQASIVTNQRKEIAEK